MNLSNQVNLSEIAIKAAILAGSEIIKIYKQTDLEIEFKDDDSPLTIADKKAHSVIIKILEQTNIPIISEEEIFPDYEKRKNWKTFWLVDPLDGTKEFIKRNGEFTVNIALIQDNKPIIGVIFSPVSDSIYFTANGEAFRCDIIPGDLKIEELQDFINQNKKKLPFEKPVHKFRVLASRSHLSPETFDYINELKLEHPNLEIKNIGSSLKFCILAEGNAEVYPRFSHTMEWDTAAGQAIIEAAGGSMVDIKTEKSLNYNKENFKNNWFIASM